MKLLNWVPAVGVLLFAIALLLAVPLGQNLYSAEKDSTFTAVLSSGDQVALDSLPEGTRIVVAPDEAYWRESQRQGNGIERGIVTGVYDDYVSIRIVHEGYVDPLAPQDKSRVVHLPIAAIARVVTFTAQTY